jgi:hypothetical protein
MDLYEELARLVDALADAKVDYALCGGLALAVHGHPRFTKDIDLLVRPEDLERILEIAEHCGYLDPAGQIPFEQITVYRTSKFHGTEFLTLDLLQLTPLFADVWTTRQMVRWDDRFVQVVSAAGLAKMKRIAGRDQDWVDLKKLGYDDATGTDESGAESS